MTAIHISVPEPEFNDFLFAPIGEDINGVVVSVLSALARSDKDPWQEAAKLAQLPEETATKELAVLIGALPTGIPRSSDLSAIAARLIELLPSRGALRVGPQVALGARPTVYSRPWWVYVAFMCFVLGSQFLLASQHRSTRTDNVEANASSPNINHLRVISGQK